MVLFLNKLFKYNQLTMRIKIAVRKFVIDFDFASWWN